MRPIFGQLTFGEQFGEQTAFFLALKLEKVFVFNDRRGG